MILCRCRAQTPFKQSSSSFSKSFTISDSNSHSSLCFFTLEMEDMYALLIFSVSEPESGSSGLSNSIFLVIFLVSLEPGVVLISLAARLLLAEEMTCRSSS
ncbi:hypothetical protein HanRHA438_Chr17g0791601 [Helianthus annuus]|nr:hypothetical protein HanRHA438_Chr17g0791601 [Helianthus annuus]